MDYRKWLVTAVGLAMVAGVTRTETGAQAQNIKLRKANRPLLRAPRGYSHGYYPALKWRVTLGMSGDTAPAMADLDLDGTMDIVLPSVDGPALFRLTQDGAVKWRVGLPTPATAGVTLGDVNRDGELEILVACDKALICFDTHGRERWRRTFTDAIHSLPTVADLDGDGRSEVLVGANDNRLHVLDFMGRDKWSYLTKSWITGGVATADIDGDGKLEIGFGSLDSNLYCLDAKGKLLWKYTTGDWIQGSAVFADVDHDGGTDLLAASDDGFLYCLSRRGTLKWKGEIGGEGRRRSYLAVGDLDSDGTLETLVTSPDGYLRCFTAFGDRIWQTADGNNGPSGDEDTASIGSPLIADFNGDKWPEILVASRDGKLRAFSAWGNTVFEANVGGSIESSPLLADADRDGKWEIYIGNLASAERKAGFFSGYELSAKGGRALWSTLKGDPYRTGGSSNAADYGTGLLRGGDYATAWEPFGIGYRPRTGVQPPRRLRVTALPLEDLNGNHDGALDPGETALFKVRVENLGKGASYDSLLTVNLGRTFLKIDRTRSYLGWIAPGARKVATFRLSAPPIAQLLAWQQQQEKEGHTPFREIEPGDRPTVPNPVTSRIVRRQPPGPQLAQLQVFESGVQAAVSKARVFNMPPLPPLLKIVRRQLIDSNGRLTSGNGNGRLDSGETVVLRLWLRNDNLTTAKSATAILRSQSSNVLVATPQARLKDVVPYGGRQVDFALRVARQVKGKSVKLTLTTQPFAERGALMPAHAETITLPLQSSSLDLDPPRLTFSSPRTLIASTKAKTIAIAGIVTDASGLSSFRFAGKEVPVARLAKAGPNRYRFWFSRPLKVGENVFPLNATDTRGNTTDLWVRIVRKP